MEITHFQTTNAPRWSVDGNWLPVEFSLGQLLALPAREQAGYIHRLALAEAAEGTLLPPIEPGMEVWAAGVTYLRSRQAREAESATGDIYQRVYDAERPELFFKAPGLRVIGPGSPVHVRADSRWNVPEPELTLLVNSHGEICGYTAGNDVSSRDIEGENPLYLPQAKVYNGSCALGPCIRLVEQPDSLRDLPILLTILRGGEACFQGETSTSLMKRTFEDLVAYLYRELDFPQGAFLMTGTGIVPPETFTLQARDVVRIEVGGLVLENETRVSSSL